MQLSENVITFQFFMLRYDWTNPKAGFAQVIKSTMIMCVICTELEKTAAREWFEITAFSLLFVFIQF